MEPAPIVCLLPVRNGGADLPGWLEAAPTWCDSVVALDDGSTDATADLLEGSELVRVLLQNPPRGSAAGWDGGASHTDDCGSAERREPGGEVPQP